MSQDDIVRRAREFLSGYLRLDHAQWEYCGANEFGSFESLDDIFERLDYGEPNVRIVAARILGECAGMYDGEQSAVVQQHLAAKLSDNSINTISGRFQCEEEEAVYVDEEVKAALRLLKGEKRYSKVSRCLESYDPEYPIGLLIEIGDRNQGCSLRYNLRIKAGRISGIVSFAGMSSRNCLDDEDADEIHLGFEKESIEVLKAYLRRRFPGKSICGVIKSTSTTVYHPKPPEYGVDTA